MEVKKLISLLPEFRESQGLDENHWKRKKAFKAHLDAMIHHKLPLNIFDKECIEYLKDDGEDVSKYLKPTKQDSVPCLGKGCRRLVFEPYVKLCVKCKKESLEKGKRRHKRFFLKRFGYKMPM